MEVREGGKGKGGKGKGKGGGGKREERGGTQVYITARGG